MNKPQILIIEDDNAIGNLISTTLETQHYQYRRAKNGASGVLEAASCRPDVILLDLGLPDMDGVDIIKKVRTWSNTPIIVISARSEDHDKVEALDAGADDYLTKPFSVEELLARLRVSLRRVRYDSEKVDEAASIYQNGGLKIDYAAGCTYQNGKEKMCIRDSCGSDPRLPRAVYRHGGGGSQRRAGGHGGTGAVRRGRGPAGHRHGTGTDQDPHVRGG